MMMGVRKGWKEEARFGKCDQFFEEKLARAQPLLNPKGGDTGGCSHLPFYFLSSFFTTQNTRDHEHRNINIDDTSTDHTAAD